MTKWKLESLLIENFRSISGRHNVPLNADIVVVHGPNGAGKTSLLSALELGATGNVAHLGGTTQLVNRNYPLGRVELGLRSAGEVRLGQIELGPGRKPGDGALTGKERVDFLERCFLPQTVLGRLLESYATKDHIDSALVRFVKDLAGIDDLDSLIAGLRPAGHLARTRVLSPAWARLEDDIAETEAAVERTRVTVRESQRSLDEAARLLRETMPDQPDSGQSLEELLGRSRDAIRANELALDELASLESMRIRLAGILIALAPLEVSQADNDDAALTVQSLSARQAFEVWEESTGATVLRVLNEIRGQLDQSAVGSGQIFEAFIEVKQHVELLSANERRAQELAAGRQLERVALEASLASLNAELAEAESARAKLNINPDVRLLVEVLSSVMPFVRSDVCPVCDQSFPAGQQALTAHIEQKIANLSEDATRYQDLTTQVDSLRRRRVALLENAPPAVEPSKDSKAKSDKLTRQLNSLETEVERGLSFKRTMDSSLARLADVSSLRATIAAADENLQDLFKDSGMARGTDDVFRAATSLDVFLLERQQAAQFRVTSTERIRSALEALTLEQRNFATLSEQLDNIRLKLRGERARLAEGKKRKAAANDLRMEAERVRASLISEVFDHALNESWADFFGRLVPKEPFVPQFRKHVKDSRNIDVVLETVDPSGQPFGSPSSVLSFGNANTAALSLFLALHVSAPTAVDWLIFDDPVQSMDEIHIANFAALIRQLTVDHDRQVVIAVHQRELFDYLAFELAPATPSEQVLKIELERRGDASVIEWERVTFVPDSAISSA